MGEETLVEDCIYNDDGLTRGFRMLFTYRIFIMALHALGRNVLRSALTTLLIVIGVGAVISMTEINLGTTQAVTATIKSMGANNLLIFPGIAASSGASLGAGSVLTLTERDVEILAHDCPSIEAVAPIVRTRTQIIYHDRNCSPLEIVGTSPAYFEVREWSNFLEGEPFDKADVANAARVCVLGQSVVRELFPNESPLGKEVRVSNVPLRVVGVLTKKGASMTGQDQDDIMVAPWTTIKRNVSNTSANPTNTNPQTSSSTGAIVDPLIKLAPYKQVYPNTQGVPYPVPSPQQLLDTPQPVRFANVDRIMVKVYEGEIKEAIEQITSALRESHHIKRDQPEDFNIRDMSELSKSLAENSTRMMRMLMFVASVSLLVGGVGIMNMMMVSVTERTREIGLRMAVGARSRDILLQFLVEAIVLCMLGGFVGILFGKAFAFAAGYFMGMPTSHSTLAMVAAVGVSAFVGVVFGFYPAWKASRLDPIEALRYE
jgi:ABC-type antimicrobial peptide transport system permease subunit